MTGGGWRLSRGPVLKCGPRPISTPISPKPGGTAVAEAGSRDGTPKPVWTHLSAAPNNTASLKIKSAGPRAKLGGTG